MKEINLEIKLPAFWDTYLAGKIARIIVSLAWLFFTAYIGTEHLFTFIEMLVLAYLGLSIIWRLSSRVSAVIALLFLIAEPFLLYFKNDALAETFAVYAFYFLVITVFQEVLWLKHEQKTLPERPVDNSPGHPKRKIV
ncbi:MAG: hypothetical protein WCX17_01185 [Parcubacteria group bacterium]|jgi:hypothetical protein